MRFGEPIRIGIVDFDTSHVVEFSKRINHAGVSEDQWVHGGRVVAGYPGVSEITPAETIEAYTAQCRDECGVEIVDRPEALLDKVDAVMIESQCGAVHLERARPFLEAGMPVFIDKPFANTVEQAWALVDLADENGARLFSSSSLRYALEVQSLKRDKSELGDIMVVDATSPGSLHPSNPGLLHYGIHGVEIVYALLGSGCKYVTCNSTDAGDYVLGTWHDGGVGIVRAMRQGDHGFSVAAWGEKGSRESPIDTTFIYRELLVEVIKMFEHGPDHRLIGETIEIISFIEAAARSAATGGEPALVGIY